jgi:hypothetical protein
LVAADVHQERIPVPAVTQAMAVAYMTIIEYAIERSKVEIIEDVFAGVVPWDVSSFSELHDYVDANEYGGLCSEAWFCLPDDTEDGTVEANGGWLLHFEDSVVVQSAVDAWLRNLPW